MKKLTFTWLFIPFFVLALFSTAFAGSVTTKTSDNKMEWAFTKAGEHPEVLLVNTINSAKSSLDVAIYSLTHPDIVKAIKEAKARGVTVRLITDKQQASGKSQQEALKILGSAGIPTKINSHSGLMHLKMVVVDRKVATTGSFNYSQAASTVNDEVLMVIRDETVAKSFAEQFDRMWNDTKSFQTVEYRIAQPTPASNKPSTTPSNQAQKNTAQNQTASASKACEKPTIKGNKNSKIYHVPGGQFYAKTTANIEWFCTEAEAQKAGYRKSQK